VRWGIGRVGAWVPHRMAVKFSEVVVLWIIFKAADGRACPELIKLNIWGFFRDVILSLIFRQSFCLHLMSFSDDPSDLYGLHEQGGISLKQVLNLMLQVFDL
jgi:hypothetical protein